MPESEKDEIEKIFSWKRKRSPNNSRWRERTAFIGLFFYVLLFDGRLQTPTDHLLVPEGKKPEEFEGGKLNLEKLYAKFFGVQDQTDWSVLLSFAQKFFFSVQTMNLRRTYSKKPIKT